MRGNGTHRFSPSCLQNLWAVFQSRSSATNAPLPKRLEWIYTASMPFTAFNAFTVFLLKNNVKKLMSSGSKTSKVESCRNWPFQWRVSTCIAAALICQQGSRFNDLANVLVYLVDKRTLWEETGHANFTKLFLESLGGISVKVLCNECCTSQKTGIDLHCIHAFHCIQCVPTKNDMKYFI